jgi:hypothetical protein
VANAANSSPCKNRTCALTFGWLRAIHHTQGPNYFFVDFRPSNICRAISTLLLKPGRLRIF